ncbi:MAG: hypothetical protein ACRD4Y_06810, partial [Candidatus Acidiferrales bacterium]
ERLYGFEMIRKRGKDGLISLDCVIEAISLDEAFRTIQLPDDVDTHAGSDNSLDKMQPRMLRLANSRQNLL